MADNKLLSPIELSEALGISIETIYAWTSQKRIPYVKMGKLVRFSRTEINRWLSDRRVNTYKKESHGSDGGNQDFTYLRITWCY